MGVYILYSVSLVCDEGSFINIYRLSSDTAEVKFIFKI